MPRKTSVKNCNLRGLLKCVYLFNYMPVCVCAKLLQLFVTLCTVALLLWLPWLLCPWDSPDKNIGVGCCALLQGIYLTQGLNQSLLWLLSCWWILTIEPLGKPHLITYKYEKNEEMRREKERVYNTTTSPFVSDPVKAGQHG